MQSLFATYNIEKGRGGDGYWWELEGEIESNSQRASLLPPPSIKCIFTRLLNVYEGN